MGFSGRHDPANDGGTVDHGMPVDDL